MRFGWGLPSVAIGLGGRQGRVIAVVGRLVDEPLRRIVIGRTRPFVGDGIGKATVLPAQHSCVYPVERLVRERGHREGMQVALDDGEVLGTGQYGLAIIRAKTAIEIFLCLRLEIELL